MADDKVAIALQGDRTDKDIADKAYRSPFGYQDRKENDLKHPSNSPSAYYATALQEQYKPQAGRADKHASNVPGSK